MAERRPPIVGTQGARGAQELDRRRARPQRAQQGQGDRTIAERNGGKSEAPVVARPHSTRLTQASEAPVWSRVAPKSAPVDTVSHRMRERLAERKRTERRRTYARLGRWAAVLGVVAAALWAFFMSPLFQLDPAKIELSGVSDQIDATAVTTVLATHEGESLPMLNVSHVADQLRALPGVLDAKVERVWPAGLRVTLVPRNPVAAIADGVGFALLDADAVKVGMSETAPADVPLLTVPVGDERVLAAVLEVIRNLPADLLGRVSGIGAQTEDTVSFALRDGPRVEWGSADDSALKAQVLAVMLASPSAASAGVIDVSAPTLPITRAEG